MKIELTLQIKPEGQIPFTGNVDFEIKEVNSRLNILLNQKLADDAELKVIMQNDLITGICQQLQNAMPQVTGNAIQQVGNQLMTAVQQLAIPETLPEPMPVNPELKIEGGV